MVTYKLDRVGRRVDRSKSAASYRRYLLGEGNRVVAEYDQAGAIVSRFVYLTRSHVPDVMMQGTNVYRSITDPMWKPSAIEFPCPKRTLLVVVAATLLPGCGPATPRPSGPCDCATPPAAPASSRAKPPTPTVSGCEFGKPDPDAKTESLDFLTLRDLPTSHTVRVQDLISVRFELMSILDIYTGRTYWLELSREDFAGMMPCHGYFGVIEGKYNPRLRGGRYGHRGGGFYEVTYAHGVCHLGLD